MHSLSTRGDIRESALYQEIESYAKEWYRPGSGAIADALDLAVSPNGTHLAFSGVLVHRLEGSAPTRICLLDLKCGEMRIATVGLNSDRSPKWSPDGLTIAYLSDRNGSGNWQLCFVNLANGVTSDAPAVDGWVEYLGWSPNGKAILLGVAAHGADMAGVHGGFASRREPESRLAWMPDVAPADSDRLARSLWIYEVQSASLRKVSLVGLNPWEAVWAGDSVLIAICSPGSDEDAWFGSTLQRVDLTSERIEEVFHPAHQLGWPSATPTGSKWAVVEALASDRWLVAGELIVFDGETGKHHRMETSGIDVTFTHWLSGDRLLVAGVRALETVLATIQVATGAVVELFASKYVTCGERYPTVSAATDTPAVYCKLEGYSWPPTLAAIEKGAARTLATFEVPELANELAALAEVTEIAWSARDGLEIQGYLLKPHGRGPFPLVMMIHGGPVWQWRPHYLAKPPYVERALLKRNYAVFQPNPRGSSGRGLKFASLVLGDVGGEDARDCLAGLDELVKRGIADEKRLGVMGVSYGGFMSSWLVTQDQRFTAAVSISPVTDWVSQELTSHIPGFCRSFLGDHIGHIGGQHSIRSPIAFARQCKTPTLSACGALDHNTPPTQALEFHRALVHQGCESVLLTYPQEGHGCRQMPAQMDLTARLIDWLVSHSSKPN